jgi:hypothetical protein
MTMSGQIDIGWSVAPFGLKDLQAKTIRESLVELQRNKFNPKSAMNPNKLSDVDLVMQDAIVGKFLEKPLTQEQLAEFISAASRFVWFHVDRRGLWVLLCPRDVRFTPESGHVRCNYRCPLWARSGPWTFRIHSLPPRILPRAC